MLTIIVLDALLRLEQKIGQMNIYQYAKTDYCSIKMPIKNTNDYLEFDDYMTIMQPFMIHADFECYNKRTENNTDFEDHKPYTLLKAKQVPYSFAV